MIEIAIMINSTEILKDCLVSYKICKRSNHIASNQAHFIFLENPVLLLERSATTTCLLLQRFIIFASKLVQIIYMSTVTS